MPTNTYVAIETQTLTTAVSTITLGVGNTIPQTYKDLVIVFSGTMTTLDNNNIRFNNVSTGSLYSVTRLTGSGSAAGSSRSSSQNQMQLGEIATTQSTDIIQIMDYANSTTFKTVLSRSSNTVQLIKHTVGMFRSTSPITMVEIFSGGGYNYPIGSTFTLYGIAADTAITSTAKATGGTITYGVEHTYHVFTAGGTFTPSEALTADVLVVAGGGAGGGDQGGGGGAGGVCYQTGRSLASGTGYTVTVGSGGTANGTTTGNSGQPSTFDTITALGGGGGGKGVVGVNGGSGGGGGYNGLAGGSATQGNSGGATGYGNAGSAHDATWNLSGAGGGAGGAGNPPSSSTTSGSGGSGLNTWQDWLYATSTGVSGYIAGGGGGGNYAPQTRFAGAGGAGGGGAGADTTPSTGTAGTVNTGSGGGGGAGATNAAGAGGSGIVIIRYAN
jgi:hypothetical protein